MRYNKVHPESTIVIIKLICGCFNSGPESPKPLRFLERVEKPVPRPPTPTVHCPESDLEETEQAVVLLQRVLRGRTIQNKVSFISLSLSLSLTLTAHEHVHIHVYKCKLKLLFALLQMFEGKEHRRQLIEELRTTHALQAPEQKIKKQEAEAIEKKQFLERRQLHKVR